MSDKPYLITSDQHCHDWDQFSHREEDGVNSRLRIILNEILRAVKVAKKAGATCHAMAGDLFHVRGSVKPSVFNPTYAALEEASCSIPTRALAGNHDLEGKDSNELGNAMQTLSQIPAFSAITEVTEFEDFIMFPWFSDLDALREAMRKHANPNKDAIIHAPLNGVIKNMPDHGLDPEELAAMGYRRVFCGHLHDHREFCDGKVYSIGALTHQTWGDPGTTAGFLLVYPDRVEHHRSEAPYFIDVDEEFLAEMDKHDRSFEDEFTGNYVRIKLDDVTESDIKDIRKQVEKAGALGCLIIANKRRDTTRTASVVKSGETLEASVAAFTKERKDKKRVVEMAMDVIAEARSA